MILNNSIESLNRETENFIAIYEYLSKQKIDKAHLFSNMKHIQTFYIKLIDLLEEKESFFDNKELYNELLNRISQPILIFNRLEDYTQLAILKEKEKNNMLIVTPQILRRAKAGSNYKTSSNYPMNRKKHILSNIRLSYYTFQANFKNLEWVLVDETTKSHSFKIAEYMLPHLLGIELSDELLNYFSLKNKDFPRKTGKINHNLILRVMTEKQNYSKLAEVNPETKKCHFNFDKLSTKNYIFQQFCDFNQPKQIVVGGHKKNSALKSDFFVLKPSMLKEHYCCMGFAKSKDSRYAESSLLVKNHDLEGENHLITSIYKKTKQEEEEYKPVAIYSVSEQLNLLSEMFEDDSFGTRDDGNLLHYYYDTMATSEEFKKLPTKIENLMMDAKQKTR